MKIETPLYEDFDINTFESDDKELAEIIEFTKKTKNEDLLNLCEKMYYSKKSGVSIEQYLYTAKELYKELQYSSLLEEFQNKISSIKELEKKLKEEISKQDKLLETLKNLEEKRKINLENITKKVEDPIEDNVKDFSIEENNQEYNKDEDISLALLEDNLTLNLNKVEEKEIDHNKKYLNYQINDKNYISIVDTDLNTLVKSINKIFADAEKIKRTKYKKETITLIKDVLEDIQTFYEYKEYVRYYYNSYKNKLDKAVDYEQHKKLLSDLTEKMNNILEDISYYLSINEISFQDINDNNNLSEGESTIVFKLLETPGYEKQINTKDVLYSMYDKEFFDSLNSKILK